MAGDKMELEDWLDDLCVRFIINLPEEDLSSVARICFQIEEAQWFYEDFIRPLDPNLPSMTLRHFSLRIFQHCPLLAPFSVENHTKAFEEFLQYKTRVPVRGAILLNENMDKTVLVKGWKKGANWSFPRGKINKDEDDLECAIREVYEETGYDLHQAGLVPENRNVKYIEITMREQQMRLYVFRNVPMDTHFAPRTRKEISKIQWYDLSELPAFRKKGNQQQNDAAAAANANKFYMVAPFLVPLKKWVVQQKKRDNPKVGQDVQYQTVPEEPVTESETWAQPEPQVASSKLPSKPDDNNKVPRLDTLEGATLELQRLLKVQPAPQNSAQQPAGSAPSNDKGASLLAILQSSKPATQPMGQPQPQTPAEQILSDLPRPHQPHGQHHPHARLPFADQRGPPHMQPLHAHDSAGPSQSGPQPPNIAPFQQQLPPGMPPLPADQGHMQHAPPPRGILPNPNMPHAFSGHGSMGSGVPGQSRPTMSMEAGSGHLAPGSHPKPLTNHSLALLGVLKAGVSPLQPSSVPASSSGPAPSGPSGQPPNAPPRDNSGLAPRQGYGSHQGPSPQWQQNVPFHQQQGMASAGRQTEAQRSALLEMFKKPSTSPNTIRNAMEMLPTTSGGPTPQVPQAQSGPGESMPHAIQQQQQQYGPAPQTHAAAPGLASPYGSNQKSPAQPYQILQRNDQSARRPTQLSPAVTALQQSAAMDKPSSLASPPAAFTFPNPSAMQQRKQSTSTDQKQKLLSLFGQSDSPVSQSSHHHVSHVPGAAASPSSQAGRMGTPGGLAESRRGSATPISPADRNFLLNYLASVTGSAPGNSK